MSTRQIVSYHKLEILLGRLLIACLAAGYLALLWDIALGAGGL